MVDQQWLTQKGAPTTLAFFNLNTVSYHFLMIFVKKTRADFAAIRASLPAIQADLPELHFSTCFETTCDTEQIRPDAKFYTSKISHLPP